MKKVEKSIDFAGRKLTLSSGHVAQQSTSAVMAQYGETVVLATIVSRPLKESWGYFPLQVEYQEKLYAGGRIKGSRWVKREGRPSDEEILTARLIDRSIRPLFPEEYSQNEVQIVVTVLSVDLESSADFVAATAVSAALHSSSIPWNGPVAIVKVGKDDKGFVISPTENQLQKSSLDLTVSSTDKSIVMIEAGGNQVPEDEMADAIDLAQKQAKTLNKFINDFAKEKGIKKESLSSTKTSDSVEKKVKKLAQKEIEKIIVDLATKKATYDDLELLKSAVVEEFDTEEKEVAGLIFEKTLKEATRKLILSGKRPDGRAYDEIRELSSFVSVLPRTHGSAIFNRGQTQAMTIATLGAPSLELLIETAEGEESKRYIHHYSMPPYSTGETGRMGSPKRREIGHGALAEKALLPVIPGEEEFPYTIQVVTEILSSNGSTSMASACGSTLSLMDAGVPIKAPVAGIAMGLIIKNPKEYSVLTDIVGLEDGYGDMDFKVAGTKDGITALQLDVKTLSLTSEILKKALTQAKKARLEILKVMLKALPERREKVSQYAPKIQSVRIPQEKIGELIGPGGKVIKGLIAETGAEIDVNDEGVVNISAIDENAVNQAVAKVQALAKDPQPGEIYEGTVKRIQNFGIFVEILPGKEGMVHISDMSTEYVENPTDVVKMDQKVQVKVKEIDELGRTNLTMILDDNAAKNKQLSRNSRNDRNSAGGNRRSFHRGQRRGGDRNRNFSANRRGGGPHFPTSRFLDEVKDLKR